MTSTFFPITRIPIASPSKLCLRCPESRVDGDGWRTCASIVGKPGEPICQWLRLDGLNHPRPRFIVPVDAIDARDKGGRI